MQIKNVIWIEKEDTTAVQLLRCKAKRARSNELALFVIRVNYINHSMLRHHQRSRGSHL